MGWMDWDGWDDGRCLLAWILAFLDGCSWPLGFSPSHAPRQTPTDSPRPCFNWLLSTQRHYPFQPHTHCNAKISQCTAHSLAGLASTSRSAKFCSRLLIGCFGETRCLLDALDTHTSSIDPPPLLGAIAVREPTPQAAGLPCLHGHRAFGSLRTAGLWGWDWCAGRLGIRDIRHHAQRRKTAPPAPLHVQSTRPPPCLTN